MEPSLARTRLRQIMEADLAELTRSGSRGTRPPASAHDWAVPAEGKAALLEHGLPQADEWDTLLRVGADYQDLAEPGYEAEQWRGYWIARCGDARIACAEAEGWVVAVPIFRELAAPLQPLHPGGLPDQVMDSSLDTFVDLAWRWHEMSAVLEEVRQAAERATSEAWRTTGSYPDVDHEAPYRRLCAEVRAWFTERDPAAIAEDESTWSTIIGGFE